MLAVVFLGNGQAEVREVSVPRPGPGEVLLRVRTSALCGSELKAYRSAEVHFLNGGHEVVGEVVEGDQAERCRPGDRVAVNAAIGCGACVHCLGGDPKFCKTAYIKHDAHAQYIAVPATACLPLPQDVPFETGVLLGGDFVGTGYRAIKRIGVTALDTALVLGAGPVGQGVTSLLRFLGLRVIVSEPSAYRRGLVAGLGATALDPNEIDVIEAVLALTEGLGPQVVFECAGRPETQLLALRAVRVKGRVGFVGENRQLTLDPSGYFLRKELTVVGSWYFTADDYREILGLYRQGYHPEQLVTHRYPIEEGDLAFATFATGETGKVLIVQE